MSNLGRVLIRGRRLSVIGVVNMNMFLVDITSYPEIEKGDEVVIIGKQKKNSISVSSFGELGNYVNYETLVRLPEDIPRKIVT
jgi:alanine racemase